MPQTIVILTGASRGLGAALARGLLQPNTHLITLVRRADDALSRLAQAVGVTLEQIQVDFSDVSAVSDVATRVFAALPRDAARYRLINNAGTVQPVANSTELTDGDKICHAFSLNVTAVMMLTAHFLRVVKDLPADRRIVNISSGAGRRPYAGWGVYCATKAALDMYTRVVKLEHAEAGVRIVSLAPGVVDTDMQADIRSSHVADFPSLPHFLAMKAEGQLASPEDTARGILAFMERNDFGQTEIDDIRRYV